MTTRIPYIRWPGAVRCAASLQSSGSKKVDRLIVGQSRVSTPSISSVAVTKPLHFQNDVQHRRFFASTVSNYKGILLDDLAVRSFSSDADTSDIDDNANHVSTRHTLIAALHSFLFHLTIAYPTANYFTR